MKKHYYNTLKLLLLITILVIIYIAVILFVNVLRDYKPENGPLNIAACHNMPNCESQDSFSVLSWNIGYAGLGNNSDFFYDGGTMIRPEREDYDAYLGGIIGQLQFFDSLDFILLQEVDTSAHRSFGLNQHELISEALSSHCGVFAKNYDVSYVPMPLFNPMANVISGLSVFSRYKITGAEQIVFPGNYTWPTALFMPDRCFVVSVFKTPSARNLHVINTHNSAFDDGELRNSQVAILNEYMLTAYHRGDYVIAGGDWNINPGAYSNDPFLSGDLPFMLKGVAGVAAPGPGWEVAFDPAYPTNRDVSSNYIPGLTPTTIIDFFVCSPNIRLLEVKTLYDGFQNTDHQPVYLRFSLN